MTLEVYLLSLLAINNNLLISNYAIQNLSAVNVNTFMFCTQSSQKNLMYLEAGSDGMEEAAVLRYILLQQRSGGGSILGVWSHIP